jgi:hypothetical protein
VQLRPVSQACTNLGSMSYTTAEGRGRILEDLASAVDQIAFALAHLGEAYEQMDADSADRLEAELFAPAQGAYARASRTYNEFVKRHGLPERAVQPLAAVALPHGARGAIESAVEATERADHVIAELQDSMLPVEVGDEELRAGLSETRALIAPLPARARELVRTLGR